MSQVTTPHIASLAQRPAANLYDPHLTLSTRLQAMRSGPAVYRTRRPTPQLALFGLGIGVNGRTAQVELKQIEGISGIEEITGIEEMEEVQ